MPISRTYLTLIAFLFAAHATALDLGETKKAAEDGDAESQFQLGLAYDFGDGVSQDQAEAAKWYRKAAEQGHGRAQNSLGSLYQAGEGVDKDFQAALRWYEAASEQGVPNAFNNLAYMYDLGLGVAEDDTKAASLYKKAAEGGEVRAMLNLGVMYAKGTGVAKDNAEASMWLDLARFYTQKSKDMDTKWHIRRVIDELEKEMTRAEIKQGKKRAKQWTKSHQE